MKKIISTILAIVFVVSALGVTAFSSFAAKETLDFKFTNAAGMPNDMVKVTLSIDNNPGFWAFEFGIFYDSDCLILRKATANTEFKELGEFADFDASTMNNLREQYDDDLENGIVPLSRIYRDAPSYGVNLEKDYLSIIEFESDDVMEDNMYTGDILELEFEVVGIAPEGDCNIIVVPDFKSVINTDLDDDEVPFTWTNSVVTIGSTTPVPDSDNEPIKEGDTVAPVETDKKDSSASSDEPVKYALETFAGDDGKSYYVDLNGEKKEVPADAVIDENGDIIIEVEQNPTVDGSGDIIVETQPSDIEVTDTEVLTEEEAAAEKKTNTVFKVVIAAAAALIIAAVLLFIFISKTNKETEAIENGTAPVVPTSPEGTIEDTLDEAEEAVEETSEAAEEAADNNGEE